MNKYSRTYNQRQYDIGTIDIITLLSKYSHGSQNVVTASLQGPVTDSDSLN